MLAYARLRLTSSWSALTSVRPLAGPFTGFSPAYNKVKERYKYSLMRAAKAAKGIATQRRMGNFDFDSIYKFTSA